MNISFPSKRVVLLWLPLLFFSCTKQQGLTIFTVSVEPSAAAKMTVADDLYSWQEGDNIWVNGSTGTVAFTDESPTVSFQDEAILNWEGNYYYYAAFPAGICSSGTTSGTLSVTLPAVYQYSQASDGKQQLPMPMVAHSTGSHLLFRHLTAALIVKIPAVGGNVVLDYVAVRSSVSALSGNATVDASSDTPQPTFVSDTSHTVTLLFDNARLSLGDTRKVMLPIPQVPDGNKFTVTVLAHSTDDSTVYYLFNQEQSTGGALSRNTIAYAPVPRLPPAGSVPLVGSGTVDSPYLIHNHVDYRTFLYNIQNGTNTFRSACFKMMADADFQGSTVQGAANYLSGYFDGNGHAIKNATVTARCPSPLNFLSLSIFPPISGGEIKDLTVENITLDCSSGISGSDPIYCGGLTSYVSLINSNVVLKNILVSDITTVNACPHNHNIGFGGIVGCARCQSGSFIDLNMTNSDFCLPNKHLSLEVLDASSVVYYGSYISYVEGAVYVKMEYCNVELGGSTTDYGVSIIAGSTPSNVGAAFGYANNCKLSTSQGGCSLSGNMLFTGTETTYLKKILGYKKGSTTQTFFTELDHSNLHFYKRNSSTSTATPVTTPGT